MRVQADEMVPRAEAAAIFARSLGFTKASRRILRTGQVERVRSFHLPTASIEERERRKMRLRKILGVIFAVLVLMAGNMGADAFALEAGSYIVPNNTYYVNPDTGLADDGGDTSTGEGMCRNATYPDCFYECKDGKHYVTVRIKLISFIKNIRFNVQGVKGDSDSYEAANYTVTGENKDENTKDFRLELPASDVFIRPTFFVGPMNRDVTYFMGLDLGTAQKDDGSFAAFNQAAADAAPRANTRGPAALDGNEGAGFMESGGRSSPGQVTQPAETANPGNALNEGDGAATGGDDTDRKEAPADAHKDGSPTGGEDEPAVGTEETPAEEGDEVIGITEYSAAGETITKEPGTEEETPEAGSAQMAVWAVVAGLCLVSGGAYVWIKKKA